MLPLIENPTAPDGNRSDLMLHGTSTSESARIGPSIMMLADPSFAGTPTGLQLSAVDHLLSLIDAPVQISPARASCSTTPPPSASRQAPPSHFFRLTLPTDMRPPPEHMEHSLFLPLFHLIAAPSPTFAIP